MRWGPFSLRISTKGDCDKAGGLSSVSCSPSCSVRERDGCADSVPCQATIDGAPLASGHTLSKDSLVLSFGAMPKASAAATSAVESAVSTAKTSVELNLVCHASAPPAAGAEKTATARSRKQVTTKAPPAVLLPGLVGWFHAEDIKGAEGTVLTSWTNRAEGGAAAEHPGSGSCAKPGPYGAPTVAAGKQGALFASKSYLCTETPLAGARTLVAAFSNASDGLNWGCLLCGRGALGSDAGEFSRRRDCQFYRHPLYIHIETPTKGRGGVQQNDSLADGYR